MTRAKSPFPSLFDLEEQDPAPVPEPAPASVEAAGIEEDTVASGATLDHHALAFCAVAGCFVPDHPALARPLDPVALARFANEVLRGVASDRPALTPTRWAQASRQMIDRHIEGAEA